MHHESVSGPLGSHARLSKNADTDSAIIFVHGFRGHFLKTWGQFPDICSQRDYGLWGRSDLYFFQYNAETNHVGASVQSLRKFIAEIFPAPPPRIFARSLRNRDWTLSLTSDSDTVLIRPVPYQYHNLFLVGHSLGGLIVRRFVADEVQSWISQKPQGRMSHGAGLVANLHLFAPAHLGFEPSGNKGAAFEVSREFFVTRVISASLHRYRAYRHLKPSSQTITDLKRQTEDLALQFPKINSLSAHLMWGTLEDVVHPGRFRCDLASNESWEENKGHNDICKPTDLFLAPLRFVEGENVGAGQP